MRNTGCAITHRCTGNHNNLQKKAWWTLMWRDLDFREFMTGKNTRIWEKNFRRIAKNVSIEGIFLSLNIDRIGLDYKCLITCLNHILISAIIKMNSILVNGCFFMLVNGHFWFSSASFLAIAFNWLVHYSAIRFPYPSSQFHISFQIIAIFVQIFITC